MKTETINTREASPVKPKETSLKNRLKNILILILFVTIAVTYFIKEYEVRQLKESHQQDITTLEAQNEKALSDLREEAKAYIDRTDQNFLQAMMKPLAWAVRAEMIRDNHEQVDSYLAQFVKGEYFPSVMVVDAKGNIEMASNKKMVGEPFSNYLSPILLDKNETVINKTSAGEYTASIPLMGYDARMGTLITVYQPETFKPTTSISALSESLK